MAVELITANTYFEETVVNNSAWVSADDTTKARALTNASRVIARRYPRRIIPEEAIFEQAIWLLKLADVQSHSEKGITSYSIDGISVALSQVDRSISPEVMAMLGRRVGRSISGRQGWIVSNEDYINNRLGRDVE